MVLNSNRITQKYKKYIKSSKSNYKLGIRKSRTSKRIINNSIILLIIIITMIPFFLSKQAKLYELIADNEITIKINGTGDQTIIADAAQTPNQIYLNDISTPLDGSKVLYNLESEINTVKLVWDSPITNCNWMFGSLGNILEIDLSKFDSSKVTIMSGMFFQCSTLTSINFSNVDTSSVTSFSSMFYQCYSLKSLDLRSFNTSLLNNMYQMFYECKSLESLDISNFNTSSVTNMFQMFSNCFALESLNLSSLNSKCGKYVPNVLLLLFIKIFRYKQL